MLTPETQVTRTKTSSASPLHPGDGEVCRVVPRAGQVDGGRVPVRLDRSAAGHQSVSPHRWPHILQPPPVLCPRLVLQPHPGSLGCPQPHRLCPGLLSSTNPPHFPLASTDLQPRVCVTTPSTGGPLLHCKAHHDDREFISKLSSST